LLVIRNGPKRYPPRSFDPPAARAELEQEINLQPENNPISVVATDDRRVERIAILRLKLRLPVASPQVGPRLVIRSIVIERFAGLRIPEIRYAAQDARKLAAFLMAPAGEKHFSKDRIDLEVLDGAEATFRKIFEMFNRLSADVKERRLRAGDTVFVT
jgi:hypothetical protein